MAKLPVAPFEKIIKENGGKRVSFSAAEELAALTAEIASEIARNAAMMSGHAGRRTVMKEDITIARKNLKL